MWNGQCPLDIGDGYLQTCITGQHNFSVAEKDQEESCILGVEYENLEKKIIIK